MQEIPAGELVRVNKAIKRLERKPFKPLSSNLNKILCRPLKTKASIFPPPPTNNSQNPSETHQIKRSFSQTSIKSKEKRLLTHAMSQKDLETPLFSETKNLMISPGIDKRRAFNEMKPLLSPALRDSLPKLNKPDLNNLHSGSEMVIFDNNQSFLSQTSANFDIKSLLRPVNSVKGRNLEENYFFPDEIKLPMEENSLQLPEMRETYDKSLNNNRNSKEKLEISAKKSFEITKRKNSSHSAQSEHTQPRIKIFTSYHRIYQSSKNPKNLHNSNGKTSNNLLKREEKEKEITTKIAKNLERLSSLPLVTRKETLKLKNMPSISSKYTENNSFSVDFQPSFNHVLQKSSSHTSFSQLEQKTAHSPDSLYYLSHLHRKNEYDLGSTKVLSSRFDSQDLFLAIGCEDSIIRIYDTHENPYRLEFLLKDPQNYGIATTCVRWRPKCCDKLLLTSQATGVLSVWDVFLNKIVQNIEEDNYTYTCDFNCEGSLFATGGSDTAVRVYDLLYREPVNVLRNCEDTLGHSNRIYSVLFHPYEPNILFSGGWDCNIFLWDIRTGMAESFIAGPMICGDSLDLKFNELLAGSWRTERQIELFDIRTLKIIREIQWQNEGNEEKSFIYSCKFSKSSNNFVVAGSTGKCEVRLFDRRNAFKNTDADKEFEYGVFSIDFRNLKDEIIVGTGEGKLLRYYIK